ncbi:MAG: hypothetical protein K2X27_21975 [Candidatus Obscuribacterales bacterium]|nr:hypothetical protein [Candidatus Obscuribacterales bacterium]
MLLFSKNRFAAASLLFFLLNFYMAAGSRAASSVDDLEMKATALKAPISRNGELSLDARYLLKQLELESLVSRIDSLSARPELAARAKNLEEVILHQELLEMRQELTRKILRANLEVDYVIAAIDGEENLYTERVAQLMSKRDKAVWNTTILSQWTNGILWSASSAFTCASVRNTKFGYPDGVLGILAGAIPSALSLYAMHQTHGARIDMIKHPNMLAPLFERVSAEEFLPKSVQIFLDAAPSFEKGGSSRRKLLLERWYENKYLDRPGSKNAERMIGILTATEEGKKIMTIDLYTNRQKMLADLRTTIFQLKRLLLELMQLTD